MPWSGPRSLPFLISRAASSAWARAVSRVSVATALSGVPIVSRRSRAISASSTGETFRSLTLLRSSRSGVKKTSESAATALILPVFVVVAGAPALRREGERGEGRRRLGGRVEWCRADDLERLLEGLPAALEGRPLLGVPGDRGIGSGPREGIARGRRGRGRSGGVLLRGGGGGRGRPRRNRDRRERTCRRISGEKRRGSVGHRATKTPAMQPHPGSAILRPKPGTLPCSLLVAAFPGVLP